MICLDCTQRHTYTLIVIWLSQSFKKNVLLGYCASALHLDCHEHWLTVLQSCEVIWRLVRLGDLHPSTSLLLSVSYNSCYYYDDYVDTYMPETSIRYQTKVCSCIDNIVTHCQKKEGEKYTMSKNFKIQPIFEQRKNECLSVKLIYVVILHKTFSAT